jgi:hypothetical protein
MGRQRNSKLVGTVRNIIFYNLHGEYYMRAKPTVVKQTKSSVHSSSNFGKASKICKQIRNLVDPINPAKSDQFLMYRLTGALNKFISWKEKKDTASVVMPKKLPFIYRFQFNDQADLSVIRTIEPVVISTTPGVTEINFAPVIPSQSLHAPTNTANISLKMMLIATNLNDTQTKLLGKSEIEIPFTKETFQIPPIASDAPIQSGDLVMLVATVQYIVNKNGDVEVVKDKKKQPCGITWAAINL